MTPLPVAISSSAADFLLCALSNIVCVCVCIHVIILYVCSAAPAAPGNLVLIPGVPTLTLEWDRPTNVPSEVQVTYLVESNSTNGNGMNFRNTTSSTSLSVHFLEELLAAGQCVMFNFFVSGSNEAGPGSRAMIVDTVPICELVHVHNNYCTCRCNCYWYTRLHILCIEEVLIKGLRGT